MPLVSLDVQDMPPYSFTRSISSGEDDDTPRKRWWHYLPLCLTVFLLLAPHPSILTTLVAYHLQTLHAPFRFITHLLVIYALTFLTFSSLIVCVVRDPGPVSGSQKGLRGNEGGEDRDESSLRETLVAPEEDDFGSPGKWCRKCWASKPERAHHCSICGRCVLKMDHHCPWIAAKCIGHWTYPAFLHFLLSISLLASYVFVVFSHVIWAAFVDPVLVDETTAIHALFLTLIGAIFALTIGSFFVYHMYLVATNQTTLESLSPFLLLRYLPPLPPQPSPPSHTRDHDTHAPTRYRLSDPPEEHELSAAQRRRVRRAHSAVRMYDVGWRQNCMQVFGYRRRWGWALRLLYGGGGFGDGKTFPRNPRADEMLARLASELVDEEKLR